MSRVRTFSGVSRQVSFSPFVTFDRCPSCSGSATPGARAVMAHWLESYDVARNLGIYNCRPVAGSSSLSIHSCGRAVDLGVPVNSQGHRAAYDYLRRLGPHTQRLGLQLVIFNAQYGSARNPWPTVYQGVHPHHDHIHLELNGSAGRLLTLATMRAVVGDLRGGGFDMFCAFDDRDSDAVRALQGRLKYALGIDIGTWGPNNDGVDGHYGTDTAGALASVIGGNGRSYGPRELGRLDAAIGSQGAGITRSAADTRYVRQGQSYRIG